MTAALKMPTTTIVVPPSPRPVPLPVDVATIPAELQELAQWIVWRYEWRPGKQGEGKWTKAPIQTDRPRANRKTGVLDWKHAASVRPGEWSTFPEAMKAYREYKDDDPKLPGLTLAGIGFVFSADDPYGGIDLDNCINPDGEVQPWAQQVLDDCRGAYREISPSGNGIKLFGRFTLPGEAKGRKKTDIHGGGTAIEIYDRGRFFAVTGRACDVVDTIADISGPALAIYDRIKPPKSKTTSTGNNSTPASLSLDDNEVIEIACAAKNGDKFSALWRGDCSRYGQDASRADFALLGMLAFYTNGDAAQMERIFSNSGLGQREKWARADYRETSIRNVLEGKTEFYNPTKRNGQSSKNSPADRPRLGVVPRDDQGDGEQAPPVVTDLHLTDMGNGERMVRHFGNRIRHVHLWKKWLVWDGRRWEIDNTAAVYRLAKDTVRLIYQEAAAEPDEFERKNLAKWARASESKRLVDAMVSFASREASVAILHDKLDADPWLLNCRNGTVDLKAGTLRPHDPADMLTKMAPVDFDPQAQCPRWLGFLNRIMAGDQDMIGFLKRAAGSGVTGDISDHAIFYLFGTGRNGKGTFLEVILALLGEYATTIDTSLITLKRNEDHPTGLTDLDGRRFVTTEEVEQGKRIAEALVKKLSGGNVIKARKMHKDYYEFKPTHKIFLAANYKFEIQGQDEGIWSRIKMIPFTVFIPPEERIKNFGDVLIKEEGPGILAWLVQGCLEWQRDGLNEPASVVAATAEYRSSMDMIGSFIGERCNSFLDHSTLKDRAREEKDKLYQAFVEWAKANGVPEIPGGREFGTTLEKKGYIRKPSNGRHYRLGITLKAEEGA